MRLPLRTSVLTAFTLTPNNYSTADLICGFDAPLDTLKIIWFASEAAVAFSVITGERITS